MTATEVLRRMLDERGVRWREATPNKTKWNSPVLGGLVAVSEWNGKLVLDAGYINVTPEQAIAATLGTGTCHDVWDTELTGRLRFQCSECGAVSLEITPRFCPACGKKVVEPTTNDVDAEVEQ